ncbi:MAG TPA: hypothetical protein ENH85_02270 [Candidatus Scalindua sp.]|nr:hypothetical protein [Candidatus Scalindua sp.]
MKTLSLIRIPKSELILSGTMRDFCITQLLHGIKPMDAGDNMEYIADLARDQPTFEELESIVTGGGYFENILLGIELTGPGAQQAVPGVFPRATYQDETDPENPVTVKRTWVQWIKLQAGMTAYKKTDESLYIIKAFTDGQMMNSTQLQAAHIQLGVNVIEWSVHQFRVRSEEWEVFEL